ncbi:unnamed protein product [Mytilus edulis]|uniref:Endonuclease/exonuclease/phosphatase domain-containing protein n=1 Tax=Mytilus edulis TaxID=6550 RepID=A0A8S3TJ96_MYTED|nr:unnamed protein product [Mytilus edulis]
MNESSIVSTSNSFETLSDSENENETPTENTNHQNINNSNHNQMKVMVVNCRSLISDKKKVELQNLIETHKPDIILGTESHLDNTIASSEVFPDQFQNPYRKDRKLGEGGVFIAVDNNYITTEILTGSDCETAWCKINTQGRQPLYIGTFYRQPCSNIDKLEELEKSINCIMNTSQNLPNVILGGDFNLPHINWQTNTVNTNPQYGKALNEKLIEISNNNDMNQMVNEPTRGQNILDLLMTTNPGLVSNIEVHPGMSDHQVVIANIDMKAKTSKKKPRLVHLFKKGDMNGLKENIQENFTTRMNNMEENTVEENWTYFKKIILQATKEFIPQKTIGSKQHVPWISTHIKRLIRRRQRRYNAAKNITPRKNWNKYKQMRDLVKKTMNEAHDNYVRQILNQEDEENPKPSLGKSFGST